MLEIENFVVVDVIILLKHNGLCGQPISSSQLCSQSIPFTNFRARETPFVCTLLAPCTQFANACIMQQCLWWCHEFWNLWISQKHQNLDISRAKHFFLQIKKFIIHQALLYGKNTFVAKLTFKVEISSLGEKTVDEFKVAN